MAWTIPIAAVDGGGIFWLAVVIFVIISKIAKASKKNAPPTQKPGLPDMSDFSPEDELRDFLKRLSPGSEAAPPPVPQPQRHVPPPPVPIQTIRTITTSQSGTVRTRVQTVHRPAPRVQPTPPPPPILEAVVVPAMPEPVHSPAPAASAPAPGDKRRAAIIADLRNRECLREAIILREILGPPLALRRLNTHAFTG